MERRREPSSPLDARPGVNVDHHAGGLGSGRAEAPSALSQDGDESSGSPGQRLRRFFDGLPPGYIRSVLTRTPEERFRSEVNAASCQACRISGTVGCAGVSVYLLVAMKETRGFHRVLLGSMAAGFAGLAAYRWTMD